MWVCEGVSITNAWHDDTLPRRTFPVLNYIVLSIVPHDLSCESVYTKIGESYPPATCIYNSIIKANVYSTFSYKKRLSVKYTHQIMGIISFLTRTIHG